jgi:hypothetical protein
MPLTTLAVLPSGEYGKLHIRVSYRGVDNGIYYFVTVNYDLRRKVLHATGDLHAVNRAV